MYSFLASVMLALSIGLYLFSMVMSVNLTDKNGSRVIALITGVLNFIFAMSIIICKSKGLI